jgi:hypothetical protein
MVLPGAADSLPITDVAAEHGLLGRKAFMRILIVVIAALALVPSAFAGPAIRVGVVEDSAVWNDPALHMDLAKLAGFDAVRMTAQWTNGMSTLPQGQIERLQRAALLASMRGMIPVVSIYNADGRSSPNDPSARAQFVEFAASVVRVLPWVPSFVVGNEPNSSSYWQPQFDSAGGDAAAQGYFQLLAAAYDAIKAVRPTATVIGGALDARGNDDPRGPRPSHSPTTFIGDLGLAYRASGRTAPLMDVLDHHIYGDTSALPPSMPHAGSTTITQGDYGKLVGLLGKAFDGTAQRGSTLPIVYGEYGVESAIPSDKSGAYGGNESSTTVDEATQGRYYAEAFRLARCQPNVIGIMIFHVIDESALGAWQSGPYYADGTPKSSLPAIRDAAAAARNGTSAACPDRTPPAVTISAKEGRVVADASDAVGVGKVTLTVNGALAEVKYAFPYAFAWTPKRKGRYTLGVRAADASGNVGGSSVVVAASRARRGDASSPSRWIFRPAQPRRDRAPRPQAPRRRG